MNATPEFERFMAVYGEELERATREHPADYRWAHAPTIVHGNCGNTTFPARTVAQVAANMRLAILSGGYSHDGRAFKATCKRLGIKHTRRAIQAFCFGVEGGA